MSKTEANALPTLINQSARLRMLSHRICLFLLLLQTSQDEAASARHRQTLAASMDEFEKIFSSITEGNASLGTTKLALPAACALLFEGTEPKVHEVRHFIASMRRLAPLASPARPEVALQLQELSEFTALKLLATLDQLTMAFQSAAAEQAKSQKERIASSLEELDSVNKTTLLISFNAKVEAMRAGDSGRTFAVLADEIRRLSRLTQEVCTHLRVAATGGR